SVSGGVYQGESVTLPVERMNRAVDRDLPALLFRREVGGGRSLFHPAEGSQLTRPEQHRLGERCLSRSTVGEDGDVPGVGHLMVLPRLLAGIGTCGTTVGRVVFWLPEV